MLYDPTTAPHLKPWLLRTLEPICDAEPSALAEYILALLKHNVPENEMRKELTTQLEEFLEKECAGFVNTLFTVLRTKTYMPYSANPDSPPLQVTPLDGAEGSAEGGIPIPLDGLLSSGSGSGDYRGQPRPRKRSNSAVDDDGRPHKGPRLAQGHGMDGQFGGQQSMGPGPWQGMGMDMSMAMNPYGMPMGPMGMHNGHGRRNQGYQPPDQKRGICRDYHNKGFCARGEMCKYSHGEDAVVPGQMFPGMPFLPMFPPFMQPMPGVSAAYNPHESLQGPRQNQQRAPLLPRVQGQDGAVVHSTASGELPVIQDLTPGSSQRRDQQPPPTEPMPSSDVLMGGVGMGYDPFVAIAAPGYGPMEDVDTAHNMNAPPPGSRPVSFRGRGRGGRGGASGGPTHSANGTFPTSDAQFRPQKREDKTLVVEKIPEEKLSLDQVHEWFKRFGTVTNVAIDPVGGKALVSFEKHDDARIAWRSEEAVFGNRFVKVFWHRPLEGQGAVGARKLKASEGALKEISAKDEPMGAPVAGPSKPALPAPPKKPSAATSALAQKQQLLEEKISAQKSLMEELGKASGDEKKEIMAKLRKLNEEMKNLSTASPGAESPEKEKEKGKEKPDQDAEAPSTSTTEDLKAKLEKLKAEAASLGLDSALGSSAPPPYRGGYRGRPSRGRGGYYRGGPVLRGGPPRGSMKLDNRPKKLLVDGVKEEHAQALRDWFESTGQLESVDHLSSSEPDASTSYVVAFKSRSAAEQGLAKGVNIPVVGAVNISWFTGKPGPSSLPTAASITNKTMANGSDARKSPEAESVHEEEEVASGWGVDEDDEDGMGML